MSEIEEVLNATIPQEFLEILSLGEWILVFTCGAYVILLAVCFLRRCMLRLSASEHFIVHRYTEIFNMWLWMLGYTLVYVCCIMGTLELVYIEDWFSVGVNVVAIAVGTLYASTVDVIGTSGLSGVGCFNLIEAVQLLVGWYQANCVWKMSGHLEKADTNSGYGMNHCQPFKFCICQVGIVSPDVKDAKDILCIQGVLTSIPVLITMIGTFIVSELNASWPAGFIIAVFGTASSAIVAALLVDWDAGHNDYKVKGLLLIVYMIGSLLKRVIELAGFLCYFVYFMIINRYWTLMLLAVNFLVMWLTQIPIHATSSYSRLSTPMSTAYLAFGSVWFGSWKRVSVDKEYVGKVSTAMPPAIDLIRYFLKAGVYFLAFYLAWTNTEAPELNLAENLPITLIAYGGIIMMTLLILIVLIEYLCFRRKAVKCSDALLILQFYKNGPFACLCGDATQVINKDMNTNQLNYH